MKAFPTPSISVNDEARVTSIGGEGGMDLRDYFAAKALQSIVLTEHYQKMETPTFKYEYIGTALAEDAYRVADAMLKARQA
jgi:hypothetical protein